MTLQKKKHPEYSILAELLEMASNEFSNHGCNDFSIPNTSENRYIMDLIGAWNGDKEDKLLISKDGKEIYTQDWLLMDYFADLFKKMAEEE